MNTSRRDFIKQSSAGLLAALAAPHPPLISPAGIELRPGLLHPRFSVSIGGETIVRDAEITLHIADETIRMSDQRFVARQGDDSGESAIWFEDRRDMIAVVLHHTMLDEGKCLIMSVTVTNISPDTITLKELAPVVVTAANGGSFRFWNNADHTRILTDSWERCYGEAGVKRLRAAQPVRSAWDMSVIDSDRSRTLSMGFASQPGGKLCITATPWEEGNADLVISLDTREGIDGVTIEPGKSFSTGELLFRVHDGPVFDALESYATFMAKRQGVVVSASVPVGWVDWYFAKATTTETDILQNLDFIASELKDFGLTYVQLDSGWQLGVETEPPPHNVVAGGPWTPNSKFPRGMKWYADRIRERGLKPGIWVRPFQMISSAADRSSHPDWFNEHGQMDFSHPGVQGLMRDLFNRLTSEWGYEYVKYDFPSFDLFNAWGKDLFEAHAAREHLHDPSITNIEAYRSALTVIRRAAHATPLLACNSLMAPTLGLADVFRIGDDVGDWDRTFRYGVKSVAARYYTNGIYWANDPDVLLVRKPFTLGQARMWASLIALSGGVVFISEKLHELPAERLDILKKSMPVFRRTTDGYAFGRPIDFLEKDVPEVWCLEVNKPYGDWLVLGLFNWSEQPIVKQVDLSSVGGRGDYLAFEFWEERYLGPVRGSLSCEVPPGSCKLVTLHRQTGYPQFLSSSRHITQGGIDLQHVEWNDEAHALEGTVSVVRNNRTRIIIAVPASFSPVAATGGKMSVLEDGKIIGLDITPERTEDRRWSVSFRQE